MSRRHAAIYGDGAQWVIEDLGARNRTRVNGIAISGPTPLSYGDVIRLGDTLLVYCRFAPVRAADPDLVGASAALCALRDEIDVVAGQALAVLVTGESGVGKEKVAAAIHRHSGRNDKDMVTVNCGTILETLAGSELFGHRKGAYTGAHADRQGLFEQARGGTLFLDEIGEMPLAAQVNLLQALENRAIRPVGATRDVTVDVRVVAATNLDLGDAIRRGTFRLDLYSRLEQWPIEVPPLRERREDIPLLAAHFLGAGGDHPMEPALAEALLVSDWRTNVRGLKAVLDVAAMLARGKVLGLPPAVERKLAAQAIFNDQPPAQAPTRSRPTAKTPGGEELERLLAECGGNVTELARRLGRHKQVVYRWLKRRGLEPKSFRAPRSSARCRKPRR